MKGDLAGGCGDVEEAGPVSASEPAQPGCEVRDSCGGGVGLGDADLEVEAGEPPGLRVLRSVARKEGRDVAQLFGPAEVVGAA